MKLSIRVPFHDYQRMVSEAGVARREVVAGLPELPAPETLREAVWRRSDVVQERRQRKGRELA